MGHDILIYVDNKIEAPFYNVILDYIGANSKKIHRKESNKKNGLRVVLKHTHGEISKKQIKRFAHSRLYFFHNTIVMDIDSSIDIYNALLSSLNEIGSPEIKSLLYSYFECIKQGNEVYNHRITILGDIYRILEKDALINCNSSILCSNLKSADQQF